MTAACNGYKAIHLYYRRIVIVLEILRHRSHLRQYACRKATKSNRAGTESNRAGTDAPYAIIFCLRSNKFCRYG